MMNRILSCILMCVSLISCIKEKQTGANLSVGDRIPSFEIRMNDGTTVTGSQLSGGVCCIVFFSTECPDCRQTMPVVQRLYDEYSGRNVRFAIISREDDYESVSAYWRSQGFTMPYSAQSDRRIYELFARTRVPRIYICRQGIIKSIFTDQPSNPTYETLSDALNEEIIKIDR